MAITLGIDIGTTKCAAVCFDAANNRLLAASSLNHNAAMPAPDGYAEQDPAKIVSCVCQTVDALPEKLRHQVCAIGVTGQMHSVMGWNDTTVFPLITWQDQRCSKAGMLDEFSRRCGHALCDGFGAATLALTDTAEWTCAATVMDYFVTLLCQNKKPVTDPADAASWGIFDPQKQQWDKEAARALDIPDRLLPEIRPSGCKTGSLAPFWSEKLGLPQGIPVVNGTGDNQASILGTGEDLDNELFLTLGTGAQLSAVISAQEALLAETGGNMEIRPFFNGRQLLVSSCLCGGKAFAWLGDAVSTILRDLGTVPPAMSELLDKIDALGVQAMKSKTVSLQMIPSFLGERGAPDRKGSIAGITLDNFTLGNLAASDAAGILKNLLEGFPQEIIRRRKKILGSGNGIRKVQTVQAAIRQQFSQDFELTDTQEEAACGAAKLALGQ